MNTIPARWFYRLHHAYVGRAGTVGEGTAFRRIGSWWLLLQLDGDRWVTVTQTPTLTEMWELWSATLPPAPTKEGSK